MLRLLLALLVSPAAFAQVTGVLTGTVTDTTGATLPGAAVVLPQIQRGAATDIDGVYRILGVPPGTYEVQVSSVGYESQTGEGVEVSDGEARLDVTLRSSMSECLVCYDCEGFILDDTVPTRRWVRGRVTDGITGAPLAGVAVRLGPYMGTFNGTASTDRRGEYRIATTFLPGSTTGLHAACGGAIPYIEPQDIGPPAVVRRDIVLFPDPAGDGIEPGCGGGQVSGSVGVRVFPGGHRIEGATVRLEGTPFQATSDRNGIFQLDDIPPGTYTAVASGGGLPRAARSEVTVRPQLETWVHFEVPLDD